MIREGADAPAVSLPAYRNGERTRVDLGEYVGEGIVVVAFYPADFNAACTMQESDLNDLDLFTMQKDVSVFGISPDSTYSHEAFAERYGLHLPLLSDAAGEAAEAYDVATETEHGERLVERAVFVVDHRGVVRYAWVDEAGEGFDAGPVKDAIGDIGGDDTAIERYRVGQERYAEGREAFTQAMTEYEDREWMVARTRFEEAEPAFAAAADSFDTAVRFAETDDFETVVDRAEEKADTLQHAANWLADSADALASGRGKQGKEFRSDAQRLLDAAADLPEPPAPDAVELTDEGIELADSVAVDHDPDEDEGYAWRADDGDAADAALDVDDAELDAAVTGADDASDGDPDGSAPDQPVGARADSHGDTVEGDLEIDVDAVEADEPDTAGDEGDADAGVGAAGTVEGDTVEGDLEMDMDAIEAADEDADLDETAPTDDGSTDPSAAPESADAPAGPESADAPGDATGAGGGSGTGTPTHGGRYPAPVGGRAPGERVPEDDDASGPAAEGPGPDGDGAPLTRGGAADGGTGASDPDPAAGDVTPPDAESSPETEQVTEAEQATGPTTGDGSTAAGDDAGPGDRSAADSMAETGVGSDATESGADAGDDVEELDLADPTEGEDEEDDDERADWDIPGQ